MLNIHDVLGLLLDFVDETQAEWSHDPSLKVVHMYLWQD